MSQWNHDQLHNNSSPSFEDFYRYRPPVFNEHRMSNPRGLRTPLSLPSVDRPPPPRLPMQPPPGRPPALPPFPRHFPPWHPPLPNRSRRPCMTGPFNRLPPQNGSHAPGFLPSWPPPHCPPPGFRGTNFPPPNFPPPAHQLPNCPTPFNVIDHRAMAQRPVNTFRQRLPGSLPFCDQRRGFQMKRQSDAEHNSGKVYIVIT